MNGINILPLAFNISQVILVPDGPKIRMTVFLAYSKSQTRMLLKVGIDEIIWVTQKIGRDIIMGYKTIDQR